METLRTYLNGLDRPTQAAYAERCGTTLGYLRKAISRGHRLDGGLVRRLDIESGGRVRREELRGDIWPELKEPHMPNTPDPKPDDRIPIGPPDCITKGGAHA